jgi:predicted nucleic acid-binding protein
MLYLDTSLLTAMLTSEARSKAARAWIRAVEEPLLTSEWAMTEVASALSLKQRRGELDASTRAVAERALVRLIDDEDLDVVPVETADFRRASDHVRVPERKLRGADALHIAVAGRLGAILHSLDDAQVDAARQLGVDAIVPVPKE